MEVTQWFNVGNNPVRPGLYEVAFFNHGREIARELVKWHGDRWGIVNSRQPLPDMDDMWRGIAA
jgi:hypothetical protein